MNKRLSKNAKKAVQKSLDEVSSSLVEFPAGVTVGGTNIDQAQAGGTLEARSEREGSSMMFNFKKVARLPLISEEYNLLPKGLIKNENYTKRKVLNTFGLRKSGSTEGTLH